SGMHVESETRGLIERVMMWASRWVLRTPAVFLVIGAIMAAVAGWAAYKWGRIDTELLEVFPPGHPSSELVLEVEREFGGVLPMTISIEAKEEGFFEDPENLAKLAELQRTVEEVDAEWA